MQKILVQGELGSFHHEAAMKLFGSDVEIIPCPSFANVFSRLEKNKTGLALVAIENSLYGTINEVADGLAHHLGLAAGKVVVDRAPGRPAGGHHVTETGPRVALLTQ